MPPITLSTDALSEIDRFRERLAEGKKPLVVFVHPPKILEDAQKAGKITLFDDQRKVLPFIRVENESFGKDNNYAPQGGFTPLAFSLLATVLERKGFESTILELSHSKNPAQMILTAKQRFESANYALIWGFSATSPSNYAAMTLASLVKGPHSLVLLGGSHATTAHEYAITHCPQLDVVFVGESEDSLPALMDLIVNDQGSLESISGITYRKKNGIHLGTIIRQPGSKLHFPDFKWLSKDYFPNIWGNERAFRIQSARGCKYRCSFCAQAIQLNVAELNQLMGYLVYLSNCAKTKKLNLFFEDATFTSDKKRVLEFCSRVHALALSHGITLSWGIQTRADCLDSEIISAISQAGCVYVYIGVESLNAKSLALVRKGVNYVGFASPIERVEDTLKMLEQNHIKVGCSVIVGLQTDDVESFELTLKKLQELGVQMIFLESVKLFPMTGLMKSASESMGVSENEIISKYYEKIENKNSNPEDQNCYLLCDPSKLEVFYRGAHKVLSEKYQAISEGLYTQN